ncbi:protein PHYTOCHROME KINASE SUBSTRATE 1 [Argentina anserina]|uniref:protein PHYTOCHROME KINASE SUBSTRATE 1 n=1 Tax=Argentina anserina TaxID=57926 RepID=UPI0021765423|nr:protein PHYTOCHROME KINASE SUBSTRATE 1 [Potentilla anserina]
MAMVSSNIRDASFSSYLGTNEETFLRKLGDQKSGQQNLSPSKGDQHKRLGTRKKEEEEEIGVFGAEKYFNGVMDDNSSKSSGSTCSSRKFYVQQQRVNLDHMKLKVQQHGTPSVRSEASCNSQSALLTSGSRKPKRTSKTSSNKAQRKSFFAALGCSCNDKNSVDINEEHAGEISFKQNGANSGITTPHIKQSLDLVSEALVKIKQQPDSWVKEEIKMNNEKIEKLGTGLNRENCFAFPDSKSAAESNLPIKIPTLQEMENEKVRKSIEVFGSPVLEKRKTALGLEKRLTMLSWDAEFPAAKSGGTYTHESDSDASSDLFEIESLTGKNNPFLARQASDGCATPTHCYAPSEASIEWSVATASAADFGSAMSDCEDFVRPSPTNTTSAKGARMSKGMVPIRHRSTVLLGCKSQKAVKVATHAHRPCNQKTIIDPQMTPRKPEMSFMPSTRFQAETTSKLTGFDPRVQGQHALAPRSLPRARSPHASHLLFMQ